MEKSIYSVKHGQLAELLRLRRQEASLTQKQVAKRLGRHHPFVHDYETGQRRLDVPRLKQVADVVRTSLVDIATVLFETPTRTLPPITAIPSDDAPASSPTDHRAAWMVLCTILRDRRISASLTESRVAERLHEPQSFVSKYETMDRRLDLIELEQVAKALDTNVLDIVEEFESTLGGSLR